MSSSTKGTGTGVNVTVAGGVAWTAPGNILSLNATYASCNLTGGTNRIWDNHIYLTKDGSAAVGNDKSQSAAWPGHGSITDDVFGGAADLWGASWTPAEINAATFGVLMACRNPENNAWSYYLCAKNFGFAIPTGATIQGIRVDFYRGDDVLAGYTAYVDYVTITVTYSEDIALTAAPDALALGDAATFAAQDVVFISCSDAISLSDTAKFRLAYIDPLHKFL